MLLVLSRPRTQKVLGHAPLGGDNKRKGERDIDNGKCEPTAPPLPSRELMERSTSRLRRGNDLRSHTETSSEALLSRSQESQVPVKAIDSPEIRAFSLSLQILPGHLVLTPRARLPAPDELTAYVGDLGVERRLCSEGGSSVWVPRSCA